MLRTFFIQAACLLAFLTSLHATIFPSLATHAVARDDVHFTAEGSEILGRQVAKTILQVLENPAP
jgi:hypothetical protein